MLAGRRFIAGGDLNSSLLFDSTYRRQTNARLFANIAGAGLHDLRPRFYRDEQQTYFKRGRRPYQLDHAFADRETVARAMSWRVLREAASELALSDHAPIEVVIDDAGQRQPAPLPRFNATSINSPAHRRKTMNTSNLCRGWTAADIRELISIATERQLAVLAEIAGHPGITTEEIAANLGCEGHLNVRATLSGLSRTTASIGVKDPRTGEDSWPFQIEPPASGSVFWRYYMPERAREVVLGQVR